MGGYSRTFIEFLYLTDTTLTQKKFDPRFPFGDEVSVFSFVRGMVIREMRVQGFEI